MFYHFIKVSWGTKLNRTPVYSEFEATLHRAPPTMPPCAQECCSKKHNPKLDALGTTLIRSTLGPLQHIQNIKKSILKILNREAASHAGGKLAMPGSNKRGKVGKRRKPLIPEMKL